MATGPERLDSSATGARGLAGWMSRVTANGRGHWHGGLALGLLLALTVHPSRTYAAEQTPEQRLEQRVLDLARELEDVKAELARLKAARGRDAPALPSPAEPSVPAQTVARAPAPLDALSVWGYGELYLTRPVHRPEDARADVARAVLGIGYRFDDRTSFNSEYEVEHAIASAGDAGEFAVEQFYVDHEVASSTTLRAGLMLMPFGLLNEHHEPTNFYGMQRNFVETLIIPSTWREGGVELNTHTASGIALEVGVTTGFNLAKWNYTPQFPPYHSALELATRGDAPLQAIHQELSLAKAEHPAGHLAVNYSGIPGFTVGGALFSGDAGKGPATPGTTAQGPHRVTLWDAHLRWLPGGFDVSAVYARGAISNLAAVNAAHPGSPNPIPSAFYGYFAQAAYARGWTHGPYRLSPFVRYERYDLGASYSGVLGPVLPSGPVPLSAAPGDTGTWPHGFDRLWTLGANLYLTPNVVVKLDYQTFDVNRDFTRLDLGLGLSF